MNNERPVHEIRLGRVKASLWANRTEGGFRFNVTVCRIYKEGDQWRTSESFGREEIPLVCKALDMAHTWLLTEGAQYRGEANKEPFFSALEEQLA